LIFPKEDPITALVFTYAIIPLGMLARPFGSLVFGYVGDVYGRRQALFLTLTGMAIVSALIALSPTYMQAGVLAPIIFCFGRVLQNFFSAGESMGGAIFLMENSSKKKRDLLSGFYNASTIGGYLLASLAVFLIGHYNFIDPGWRVLYLLGSITAIFGLMIRRSPQSNVVSINFSESLTRLRGLFWTYRKALLLIIISSGFSYSCYSIALVLMNGFIPLVTLFSKTEVIRINTYLLVLDFCLLPIFGWIASKMAREKLMLAASLGSFILAIPLVLALKDGSLLTIIAVRSVFVILGVAFSAPFHAWAYQLIPSNCRYVIISLGYALGSQLFGGPTAAVALWCFQKTGWASSVAWYWMALAFATSFVIFISNKNFLILKK
jgi:MHS family proline/betaine transporter-like MFS transporter